MKETTIIALIFLLPVLVLSSCSTSKEIKTKVVSDVITGVIGKENIGKFDLKIDTMLHGNTYRINVKSNKVLVNASNPVSLYRGVYDYLTNACNSIVSWSGNNINLPEKLPKYTKEVSSPYQYHYYFNVVTHGYSTPYWDWARWEKEIDWMAFHGYNMPLLPGAHEAILNRVFKKLGLTKKEIDSYFTGPAFFSWNKMGNISGWDGPLPDAYFEKQIKLNHQILDKLAALKMHPIIPAFAGFVPEGIQKLYPNEKIRSLNWGGFEKKYQAHILEPGSALFTKIGMMYIEEYEKEFGKQEFYLADSFNEMDVPLPADENTALKELASYGASVYQSIKNINPDATWVMQGWTFPYQKRNGKLFWTPDRFHALVSKVPDDKLLILDLANEYNRLWWKLPPSWKMFPGFFNKKWIYSFIPNMGGKTALNGRLDIYATIPFEALNYENKGNLTGFGAAPEGIENNEIIYELISDTGWRDTPVNLNQWIEKYCQNRYGAFPDAMKKAFEYFKKSCYGSFTDHPRNAYQFRPGSNKKFRKGSINTSDDYRKGVALFLSCSNRCSNDLYTTDVIEYTCQFLGIKVDEMLEEFVKTGEKNKELLYAALDLLAGIDRLIASHPNWQLKKWTDLARKWGDTPREKNYYEADARRIITTWGGVVNEYAAKTWSGLIRDYYIPRWKLYYEAKWKSEKFDILQWEENWIHSNNISKVQPYKYPIEKAKELFEKYNAEIKHYDE